MSANKYVLPRRSVSRNKFPAKESHNRTQSPNTSVQLPSKDHPIGLANIGKGGPLNSIIQFLYAAQDFRQYLIGKQGELKAVKKSELGKLLGMIFRSLKDKDQRYQNTQKQTEILNIMTQDLVQVNKNYQRRFEEDSLEALMNILNEIQKEHNQLTKLFDIEYSSKCRCCQFSNQDRVITYSEVKCMTCGEFNQIKLITAPKYIIYFNQLNINPEDIKTQIGQGQKRLYTYIEKARVIYMGKGKQGRYVVQSENDKKWYQFTDELVDKAKRRSVKEIDSNEIILLYELQQAKIDQNVAIPANRSNHYKDRIKTLPTTIVIKEQIPIIEQKEDELKTIKIPKRKKEQTPPQVVNQKEKSFQKIPLKWVSKVKFVQKYSLNHPYQRFIMMKGPQGILLRTVKRDNKTLKEQYADFSQQYNKMKAQTNKDAYAKILAQYLIDKLLPSKSPYQSFSSYRMQKEKLSEPQKLELRHAFKSDQHEIFVIFVYIQ